MFYMSSLACVASPYPLSVSPTSPSPPCFPPSLLRTQMLYEYLPLPAFVVCLIIPAIYLYRVTKDLSPVEAADELNKKLRQADQMLEELTKEEEAEERERRKVRKRNGEERWSKEDATRVANFIDGHIAS